MKFGLAVNTIKPGALRLAAEIYDWGVENGVPFLLYPVEGKAMNRPCVSLDEWLDQVETAFVLGGDGTFLRIAHMVQNTDIKLFGISAGHLGFLSNYPKEKVYDAIRQIISGDYSVERRPFLEGLLQTPKGSRRFFALNDFVLTKGIQARLVNIAVSIQGKPMCEYRSDGIIVSTPTGSTAYALSAGGPIVPPELDCMLLVPICAHTLYARPTLHSSKEHIVLQPKEDSDLFLTIDGDEVYPLGCDDRLEVFLSETCGVNIITLPQFDYYDLLHEKLMWGWNPVSERS